MVEAVGTEPQNLAILFADIVDSSRLYATYGDAEARRIVSACLDRMTQIVSEHRGAVVKTIGDEIMCSFPSADEAVTAAVQMHRAFARRPRTGACIAKFTASSGCPIATICDHMSGARPRSSRASSRVIATSPMASWALPAARSLAATRSVRRKLGLPSKRVVKAMVPGRNS